MPRIPYGTKYTVRATGSILKPVICENCGCEYFYQIKHQTTGSATNVLWLNKQGAINNAENNANQNLEKYLENAVCNYPCPDCGFYQADMVQRMKNNIWQRAIVFGVIAFVVVIALTAWSSWSSSSLFYALASGLIVSLISLSKLANFDPNSDAQARINQKFSESYPVLKNKESMSARKKASGTEQVVNPVSEIFCPNCGNAGLPKDLFCRKCGNSLITEVLQTNKLAKQNSSRDKENEVKKFAQDNKITPKESASNQNTDNKQSKGIPDISDLLQLAQKHKILVEKNAAKISERLSLIRDTVHKPWIQIVLEQDSKKKVFPKGAVDAQEYLNMSLSFTLRSLGIAFVLGWEYAEHYKENPYAIIVAEKFDSVAIVESTKNELKRISDYGAFWIMRLDEMCLFAGYDNKVTMLAGLDMHKSQVQDVVFMAFKDGIINYYDEVLG